MPAKSLTEFVIVAVYEVFGERLLAGANNAVVPEYETKPGTEVVPNNKLNVDVVIVEASISTLNVAAIFWLIGTPVAALTGSVYVTEGGVIATAAPVVKIQTKFFASAMPAGFFAIVVMVAIYGVFASR